MKYLGNKNRLLDFISEVIKIEENEYKTGMDLCCGTGTVSEFFKVNDVECHSVDLMNYSYTITKTKIEINSKPNVDLSLYENKKYNGFISKNYSESSGVCIFKDEIAEYIDGGRIFLDENKNLLDEHQYSYILSSLIEAADFRSNIMGTYASFYKKGWRNKASKKWSLNYIDIKPGKIGKVYQSDVLTFLKSFNGSVDFIYMDPPYNHRQYSDNFHVLETLSLYDSPETKGKIKTRKDSKKSNFCYKTKVIGEFSETFELCSKISNNFYLSYNTDSLLNIDIIKELLLKHFDEVLINEIDYRQFKTNSKTDKKEIKEVILYAKKINKYK
jgi:adenine-specific DNA-methyltransferase